jgi:hypothetical protein
LGVTGAAASEKAFKLFFFISREEINMMTYAFRKIEVLISLSPAIAII